MSESAERLPGIEDVSAARARLAGRVLATPTFEAADLGEALDQPLWIKAENLQRTGSFKARGASNWILSAAAAETDAGLITVSAGNHAMALAWAAAGRVPLTVLMPEGSSRLKIEATRAYGAEVIVHGSVAEAVARMHELRRERGLTLVHPYDDPRVIAGQGTVGLELLDQLPATARVLCPVGGGGLISGIGIALKATRPDIELIGVEPAGAATMRHAWNQRDAGATLAGVDTVAASLAPVAVGRWTYAISRRTVDDIVTVSEDAIAEATKRLLLHARLYVETGCSVGLAALLEGRVPVDQRPTVLIVTGGNMDPEQAARLLA